MSLRALDAQARAEALCLRGAFHLTEEDDAPLSTGTLLLLGPDEPAFWTHFTASPEYGDGRANPLDRWSKRVLDSLAKRWAGAAILPYDGPPYAPFIRWALKSRHVWQAPVGLLVHDDAGLWISYRGAIALPDRIDLPPTGTAPCLDCAAQPCATACPVNALGLGQAYDVAACRTHVASAQGKRCREDGCLVRSACPVSQRLGRQPEQAAFHMAAFL